LFQYVPDVLGFVGDRIAAQYPESALCAVIRVKVPTIPCFPLDDNDTSVYPAQPSLVRGLQVDYRPGETIEPEGVLLFRHGDDWTASAWVDFLGNCAIPYWRSLYWSQR